jgi:hypothetical protein
MKPHIIVMILGLSVLKASATDPNWYLGAGGGLAEIHGGYDQVIAANSDIQRSRSTQNPVATWNLAAGYRLSPYFAVEADYEQPSAVNSLTILDASLFVRDQTLHRDLGLSLVGSYPLNTRLRLYAGAGLGHSWEREHASVQFPSSTPIIPITDTTQQFWRAQLRAGAELSLTHALALRMGWDRPDADLRNWRGYNSIQELSIDNFSVTALWAF